MQINGSRKLFDSPGRTMQTSVGPVLGPREIMFPPTGPHSAIVHNPTVSVAPFLVDLDRP